MTEVTHTEMVTFECVAQDEPRPGRPATRTVVETQDELTAEMISFECRSTPDQHSGPIAR